MKTNHLLLMAMTALLTAGCSQNEIMEVSPDAAPPVGFNVYATAQTRGTITDNNNGATGIKNATGFGVLAYHTGQTPWANAAASTAPNFMYNQKVTYSGGWTYSPVKYWPNTVGDKISFFAYAPYSDQNTSPKPSGITLSGKTANDKGAPTLVFQLQATPNKMVDLVATNATGVHASGANQAIDITKRTTAVAFKFDHVLTRANFKARVEQNLANSPTYIFVTGMRILGKDSKGANGNASGQNNNSKFYDKATYNWSNGTWTYPTTASNIPTAAYEISDNTNGILNKISQTTTINSNYTTQGIKVNQTAGTATDLFKPSEFLFLIPPADITGITSANDVRVQIDYDIVTKDVNLAKEFSITSTTATISLPNGTLKRGSAYDFIFTIGLEKVQVSATVTNWAAAIPVVYAEAGTAAAIGTAITTLNASKTSTTKYFIVNVPSGTIGGLNISTVLGSATAFASGDKIELNFAANPGVTSVTIPTTWKADKTTLSAVGKIILTKN